MTRIGVYPLWEDDLLWFIQEHFCVVSNLELLHDLIMNPLLAIRREHREGKANPYVLRERHRKWVKTVNDRVGLPNIPSWEDVVSEGHPFGDYDCDVCDYLFSLEPDWFLCGDSADLVYTVADREPLRSLTMLDSAQDVVRKMVEAVGCEGITDLMLAAPQLDRLYVVKSNRVELCGDVHPHSGYHAFENIADALEEGDYPTYVFSRALAEDFMTWRTMFNSPGGAE